MYLVNCKSLRNLCAGMRDPTSTTEIKENILHELTPASTANHIVHAMPPDDIYIIYFIYILV